jgi:hypothetical protein
VSLCATQNIPLMLFSSKIKGAHKGFYGLIQERITKMKDIYNREVKVGNTVVFNHPNYSLLESSVVLDVIQSVGVKVICHNADNSIAETIIPEKQFVIINKEN